MVSNLKNTQGFSLVEVIVVSAVAVMVFGALFASFQYSLQLLSNSQAKLSAQSVANDRMEYFRSLPYNEVGTISGIPAGTIPQNSTITLNGIDFQERVLVEYYDDPADGLDVNDDNGIPSDYKRIKVEYTWLMNGATSSIAMVSNIVPRSIETTEGGGTVKINVIDENASFIPGAEVRLVNNTTTTTIDVTRYTNASGIALFSGAPAASDYEVTVTADISGKPYSITGTYVATTSNPNPTVAPFSVLESDISTLTFQIGELSDLELRTLSSLNDSSFEEDFSNLLSVASSTNVASDGNNLELADNMGVYENSGIVYLGPITPATLESWSAIRIAASNTIDTSHKIQLFTGSSTGPWTLVPDEEFPSNSGGFTDTLVDLTGLDIYIYPSIYVGITLETTNTSVTPEIDDIAIYYREEATIRPSVTVDVTGAKTIGATASGTPIYKYEISTSTDSNGELTLSNIEFDNYTFSASAAGYDIATVCGGHPFIHQAGIDGLAELILVADADDTLLVTVVDDFGQLIPGATVNLQRSGYDVDVETNVCGQSFFTGGVGAEADYVITVSASGYSTEVVDPFEVSGDTVSTIVLSK